jgi:hypothetical protein
VSDLERAVPLAGPIEELRLSAFTDVQARAMLAQALTGVELGGLDREILAFLPTVDTRATVVVASLIRRAWSAGVQVGRAERLDEVAAVAAAHRATGDLADTVLALVERALVDLDDEHADRQYVVEHLIEAVTRAVEGYSAGSDRMARAAAVSVARYRAVLAKGSGGDTYEARQLAFTVSVECAATMLDSDAELAAAVRAVVAVDQEQYAAALGQAIRAHQAAERDAAPRPTGDTCWLFPCERPTQGQAAFCAEHADHAGPDDDQEDGGDPAELRHCLGCGLRYGHAEGCRYAAEVDALLAPAWTAEDPADVVDQDQDTDVEWCVVCDEQPATGDGLCSTCRVDIAEGRRTDPAGCAVTPTGPSVRTDGTLVREDGTIDPRPVQRVVFLVPETWLIEFADGAIETLRRGAPDVSQAVEPTEDQGDEQPSGEVDVRVSAPDTDPDDDDQDEDDLADFDRDVAEGWVDDPGAGTATTTTSEGD